ncbi:MAG TPA: metallophosphoesterase family protein, partial [Vicinamibacterales bacterium]
VRAAAVDLVLVGGDVVPGPMPRETVDLLRALELPTQYIRGNGDREVAAVMRGEETGGVPEPFRPTIRWNAGELAPGDEPWLTSWPLTRGIHVDGIGEVLFCHATPRNDVDIFTRLTPAERLVPVFDGLGPLAVCGHTHMQFDRIVGTTRIVNAGSVGMPFGQPGAYWLLLGPGVELRRTSYDLAAAASRIRATNYPQADAFAANNVLQPASEESILEMFRAAEIK